MPVYKYNAVDLKGKHVQGELEAENPTDLARILQASQLFLVTAHAQAEENVSGQADFYGPGPVEHLDDVSPGQLLRQLTRRQITLLLLTLLAGLGIGLWRAERARHFESNIPALQAKMAEIHPGMTRREVEEIFPRLNKKTPNPAKDSYFEPPNAIVKIPYDEQGGIGSEQNRVGTGIIQIYLIPKTDGK